MRIIFVCTGNTCRSPIAEGYLKAQNLKGLTVESRGLYCDGSPASINSRIVTSEWGIDISEHISKTVSADDLNADLIICLSENHYNMLIGLVPNKEKLIILGNGIPDPYGGDLDIYRETRNEIAKAIDTLIDSGKFLEFTVREGETADAEAIAKIENECFSEPWSENAITNSINSSTKFFVAEKDNKLIGYISINTVLDEGYINNIAVTADYRSSGVGRLLLARLMRLSRELSLSFISLEVRASNQAAISLYEKFQFKQEGLRRGFYQNPREDALIMTRRF